MLQLPCTPMTEINPLSCAGFAEDKKPITLAPTPLAKKYQNLNVWFSNESKSIFIVNHWKQTESNSRFLMPLLKVLPIQQWFKRRYIRLGLNQRCAAVAASQEVLTRNINVSSVRQAVCVKWILSNRNCFILINMEQQQQLVAFANKKNPVNAQPG